MWCLGYFFSASSPPCLRIEGTTSHLNDTRLNADDVKNRAYSILSASQAREFEEALEMDAGISIEKIGRFRGNLFRQRGEIAILARHIREEIASTNALNLPDTFSSLIMAKQGLVLIGRTINSFPDKSHHQILVDLSLNLSATISQRLVMNANGRRTRSRK